MSWNAFAGAMGGAQQGLASYLALKQQERDNLLKTQAANDERDYRAKTFAQQQEQINLMKAKWDEEKQQTFIANTKDTLGGLTQRTADPNLIADARKAGLSHLVVEDEGQLPSRSLGTAMMGGKIAGDQQASAGREAGTFVTPYLSEKAKLAMGELSRRTQADEFAQMIKQGQLDLREQQVRNQAEQAAQMMGLRIQAINDAASRAEHRSEADHWKRMLEAAQLQQKALVDAITLAQGDAKANPFGALEDPNYITNRTNAYLGNFGNPQPVDWTGMVNNTRPGPLRGAAPPAAPQTKKLKDGGTAQFINGQWRRVG